MTVAELIDELGRQPQDAEVVYYSGDEIETVERLYYHEYDNRVALK